MARIKNFPLPREIRNLIYEQLLDANILESEATKPSHSCIFHTAILGVNKEIGREAKEILYERNTFVLVTLSAGAEQDLQTTFDIKYKKLMTPSRPVAAMEISRINNTVNMHAVTQAKTKRPPNMTILLLSKYIYNFASLLQWRLLSLQSIECASSCSLLYHSSDGISSIPYTSELARDHPHAAGLVPQFTIILRDVKVDGISRGMTLQKAKSMLAHFVGCKGGSQKIIISSPVSLQGTGGKMQELLSYDRIWLNAMAHDVHGEAIKLWSLVERLFRDGKYDQVITTVARALQMFFQSLLPQCGAHTLAPAIGRSIYYTCIVFFNMLTLAYLARLKLHDRGHAAKDILYIPSVQVYRLSSEVMNGLGMFDTLHRLMQDFAWLECLTLLLKEYELMHEPDALVSAIAYWRDRIEWCVNALDDCRSPAAAFIERDLVVLGEFAESIQNGHLPFGYALAHDIALAKLKSELGMSRLNPSVFKSTLTGAYAWKALPDVRGWTSLAADKQYEEILRGQEQEQAGTV